MSNRLALVSIKSFSINRLYKTLGFKAKELCNINNIGHINKCKAICSKVSKGD